MRALLCLLVVLLAALGAYSGAPARDDPPAEGSPPGPEAREPAGAPEVPAAEGTDGAPAPDAAPGQPAPEVQSPYIVRAYKIRPAKLWKGLLESLGSEGFPPEEVDDEKRIVRTSFVDFKQDDYLLQVAEPPQRLGGGYHILQMIKVKQGKVSLEGVVAPGKEGTELKVRARILVMGLDRVKRVRLLVDRRSTGVIESEFIHKLEARLGLEHL